MSQRKRLTVRVTILSPIAFLTIEAAISAGRASRRLDIVATALLPRRELLSLVRAYEQFQHRGVQLHGDRIKNQYAGIVDASFDAPHHIRMDSGLKRERLLAQVALLTAFPNFFTEGSKYRSCAHAQGSIYEQDVV